ncbi:MAG: Crp/Fnr family transcriptional regulator [Chloroflexi bacterium]|nr:Crp/Fnr family transcriptional regulator [Chloroflexota bacterium]
MTIPLEELRTSLLFGNLADEELLAVGEVVSAREYPARALVFTQGERLDGLWFVRRGRVRLYRVSPTGREFTLCIARRDHLPCMGMCPLFDGNLAPAHAQALEPTTIYFIERTRAYQLAAESRGIADLLARVLANHTRYLTQLSAGLALRCSLPRLNELLLGYAEERGRAGPRGIELQLDLTREMLASVLGTTPQMVTQMFQRLEQAGLVDARGKHIVILDKERLAKMV